MEHSNVSSQVSSEPVQQVPKSTAELVAEIFHVSPSTVKRAAEFTNAVDVIAENVQNIDRDIRDKILNEEIGMSIKEIIALAEEDLDKQQRRISRALADLKAGIKPKPEKPEKKEKSPEEKITQMYEMLLKAMERFKNWQLDNTIAEASRIRAGRPDEDLFDVPAKPLEQTSSDAPTTEEPEAATQETEPQATANDEPKTVNQDTETQATPTTEEPQATSQETQPEEQTTTETTTTAPTTEEHEATAEEIQPQVEQTETAEPSVTEEPQQQGEQIETAESNVTETQVTTDEKESEESEE